MKKNSIRPKSSKQVAKACEGPITIGMNLGDRTSRHCLLGEEGTVLREGSVGATKKAMAKQFRAMGWCRIAIKVGSHSPWLSRLLKSLGHEVIVANAR